MSKRRRGGATDYINFKGRKQLRGLTCIGWPRRPRGSCRRGPSPRTPPGQVEEKEGGGGKEDATPTCCTTRKLSAMPPKDSCRLLSTSPGLLRPPPPPPPSLPSRSLPSFSPAPTNPGERRGGKNRREGREERMKEKQGNGWCTYDGHPRLPRQAADLPSHLGARQFQKSVPQVSATDQCHK